MRGYVGVVTHIVIFVYVTFVVDENYPKRINLLYHIGPAIKKLEPSNGLEAGEAGTIV